MSDIFLSYSSSDRARAALLARALETRGWSVWWDRTIPPGREYDEVIEEALAETRCVVVLWSKASAASSWVKNEASEAMIKKALIPALIEDQVKIPFEFRRVQAADLSRWQGDATMPEFVQFCDAIAAEIETGAPSPAPAPGAPHRAAVPAPARAAAPAAAPQQAPAAAEASPTAAPKRSKKPYVIGGIVVLVLLVIASMINEPQPGPLPSPSPVAMPGTLPAHVASAGIHQNLVWRDYVLAYSGSVSWDGNSNTAFISVNVMDGPTRQPLGSRQVQAIVSPNGPGQIVVSTSVAVAGDSRTPGPHSHNVNLVFQAQPDGTWTFLRNCMAPNDCY
jgi:hypothetical protein